MGSTKNGIISRKDSVIIYFKKSTLPLYRKELNQQEK